MKICLRQEQPLKAEYSISNTEDGIWMLSSEVRNAKKIFSNLF
jgi:hypothetical protein